MIAALNFAGSNFKFPKKHPLIIFFVPSYLFDSIFTETTWTKLPLACLFCFVLNLKWI